ncbi:hypothetical protein [Saccharopolyspora cebuensis]|uniref:Uncharacterized protein n=1 Tax=Saccharopolyspora cebuensis TaxID=418759 RepID=A0ABV4CIG8_9PSEU
MRSARQAVDEVVAGVEVEPVDPGSKQNDIGEERRRRSEALRGFGAALEAEELIGVAAAEVTADAARRAIWLGASLADLSAVTGRSRQAARKRWPQLGHVHRKRKWLADHVDDIRHVAGLVAERAPRARPADSAGFDDAVAALRAGLARCTRDFAPDAAEGDDPAARWLALDELVDGSLRRVLALAAGPADADAGFALHAAAGVLAYYDHATATDRG